VAFSADGKLLATADGTWDVATGKQLTNFRGAVGCLALAPNGTVLASSGKEGDVKLWDVITGQERASLKGPGMEVTSLAFSPDGNSLAAGSAHGVVKVWETTKPLERATLKEAHGPVAFDAEGKSLIAIGREGRADVIKQWDLATGQERVSPRLRSNSFFQAMAISADGRTLATTGYVNRKLGDWESDVKLWDMSTGKERATIENRKGSDPPITPVAITPDGRIVAWGVTYPRNELNGRVKLRDVVAEKELHILEETGGPLAFSSNGKHLGGVNSEKVGNAWFHVVKLWDVTTGKPIAAFEHSQKEIGSVTCLAFAPNDPLLALGTRGNRETNAPAEVILWHVTDRKQLQTLKHPNMVSSVAFAHDGRTIASRSEDSAITLWDVATGRQLASFLGPPGTSFGSSIAFSPDGLMLAAGGDHVKLWDVASVKCPVQQQAKQTDKR
jgi:WD40 repeat protein